MGKIFDRVYEVVKKIPKGKALAYGQVAKLAGTCPKVVGYALHANPDSQNIPCHRVVFKDGSLAKGYLFGGSTKQKEKLLEEGVVFLNEKVVF